MPAPHTLSKRSCSAAPACGPARTGRTWPANWWTHCWPWTRTLLRGWQRWATWLCAKKKTAEAQRALATLRARHPSHVLTQELETLVRVYGPDREKLAQMRLMARAGRKAEAANLARELFPQGPPTLGGLALEYHQIMGSTAKQRTESQRQLAKLYQQTGESRYRLAQLELRMYQGGNPTAVVQEIEALAKQPDTHAQQLQDLWRRALDRLTNTPANLPRVRAFLQRYPADSAMVERLAAMQQAVERAERAARDPANIARQAARAALDQGDM